MREKRKKEKCFVSEEIAIERYSYCGVSIIIQNLVLFWSIEDIFLADEISEYMHLNSTFKNAYLDLHYTINLDIGSSSMISSQIASWNQYNYIILK